ncbi:MAG: S1/P1 nuclease, partial [Pyrinomonadaceae bacterium]|nr:S1/P1 nuclease [Pyrinomonadaceae bacterium]
MENNTTEVENDVSVDDGELTMPDGTLFGVEFWGISRHELIGGAAMAFLSNRARTEVERILAPINKIGLEDIAGWADRLRGAIPNPDPETTAFLADNRNRTRGTWHYVNLPHGVSGYSREEYPQFTRSDDVVQMIRHCVLVLKGESDRFSELNALRWLTHLVGDVHQPIHVGCGYLDESSNPARLVFDPEFITENNLDHDRGGNRIKLPNAGSLHSFWDSRLLPEDEADEPQADEPTAAGESDFDNTDADVSPELKKRFIQKLVDRVKSKSLDAADAAEADEPASDLDGLPPEDWATVWATDSIRHARQAYQSLRIVENLPNGDFRVEWEGREAY